MKGYVYIMSNKAMDGILKIGYSTKDPSIRAKELSSAGVPFKYKVEYEILVDNPEFLENKVHYILKKYNVNKEWFNASIEICIDAIKKCYSGNIYYEGFNDGDDNNDNSGNEINHIEENNDIQSTDLSYSELFDAAISDIDVRLSNMNFEELKSKLASVGYPNNFNEDCVFVARNAYEYNCFERVLLLKQIKMIIETRSEDSIGSSTLYNMLEKRRGKEVRNNLKYKGKLAPWASLVSGPELRKFVANFSDYLHISINNTEICKR